MPLLIATGRCPKLETTMRFGRRLFSRPGSRLGSRLANRAAVLVLFGSVAVAMPGTLRSTAFSQEPANIATQIATPRPKSPQQATDVTIVHSPKTLGTLSGKIILTSKPRKPARLSPQPEILKLYEEQVKQGEIYRSAKWEAWKRISEYKVHDQSVIVGRNSGLGNVFVWLTTKHENLKPSVKQQPRKPVSISMVGGRFNPRALAFRTWNQLSINNRDKHVGNFHAYPLKNQPFNRQMYVGEKRLTTWKASEPVPFRVGSDYYPWMSAYLLPLDHSLFAVTRNTGSFKIENIPPGDWQVKIWHETCGYLKNDVNSGSFQHNIKAGTNSLGTMKVEMRNLTQVKPKDLVNDAAPDAPKQKMLNDANDSASSPAVGRVTPEDDWAWFDPYPELGHADRNGDGWRFVRLASHAGARIEIGTTQEQQQAISSIYSAYNTGQPNKVHLRIAAKQIAHWATARQLCEPLLTAQQIDRIDQIAIQRMTDRAFTDDRIISSLKLSDDQSALITIAIEGHSKRLRGAANSLKSGESNKLRVRRHIELGQQSHKQVWMDIRNVLTDEQVVKFNTLRGSKVRPVVAPPAKTTKTGSPLTSERDPSDRP